MPEGHFSTARRGEIPPTAGLVPRMFDLFGGVRGARDFCHQLEPWLPAEQPILTASGTAAMFLIFSFLKQRSTRRTVIVPAYSCPLVVKAAAEAGLSVVVCDIRKQSLDLDLAALDQLLGPDVLCVVPTDYGGALVDISLIAKHVRAYSPEIFVVADCAQAFGARWGGQPVGVDADATIFSFSVGKGFTLLGGGCLVTQHVEWRQGLAKLQAQLLPNNGLRELQSISLLLGYHALYNRRGLSMAYGRGLRRHLKAGDVEAAIGDRIALDLNATPPGRFRRGVGAQALKRLGPAVAQANAQRVYMEAHWRAGGIFQPLAQHGPAQPNSTFAFALAPSPGVRQRVLDKLWGQGIGLTILFFKPLSHYTWLKPMISGSHDVPQAEALINRLFTLSTSPYGAGNLEHRLLLIDDAAN